MSMYLEKNLKNKNPAKPKFSSFKDRIESFSRKALFTSVALASLSSFSYSDPIPFRNDLTKFVKSDLEYIKANESEKLMEINSFRDTSPLVGILGVAYVGTIAYFLIRRKKEDKIRQETLE